MTPKSGQVGWLIIKAIDYFPKCKHIKEKNREFTKNTKPLIKCKKIITIHNHEMTKLRKGSHPLISVDK